MAIYIYHRVSTEHQDYLSQKNIVDSYMLRVGIDPTKVKAVVVEKISGGKKADERKLGELIKQCESGDIILTSELSRFGRDALDVETTVKYCQEHGVSIHFIHENIITNPSGYDFITDLMIKIIASFKERERLDIKFRQAGAYRGIKDKFERGETHRSRAGNEIDHLGNLKGCDTSKARAASVLAKAAAAQAWRESSVGFAWVKRQIAKGWSNKQIISEFNELHEASEQNAKIYCTRKGGKLTAGILSQWKKWITDLSE